MNRFRTAVLIGVFAVCVLPQVLGQSQPPAASTSQPSTAAGATEAYDLAHWGHRVALAPYPGDHGVGALADRAL